MKIFILFFLLFFSSVSFSLEICIGDGCPTDVPDGNSDSFPVYEAVYDPVTGTTSLQRVDGTVNTPGVWNPKTFSCTNFVVPVVNADGSIGCPAQADVKVADHIVTPNPSKDDEACDATAPIDPDKPQVGCASEETLMKTNDLISESNSKLGSIASSSAIQTGLLSGILGTLRGIASQGAVDGTGAAGADGGDTGTGDGGDTGTGTDPGDGSIVLNTDKDVVFTTKLVSSSSLCPTAETFTVLGVAYELSYQPICYLSSEIRDVVVALGAFSALMIVVTAL